MIVLPEADDVLEDGPVDELTEEGKAVGKPEATPNVELDADAELDNTP